MIVGWVETSGESPELARAEVAGAAEALGGRLLPGAAPAEGVLIAVELPDAAALPPLAGRLALARRCLLRVGEGESLAEAIASEARSGEPAAFRRIGGSAGGIDDGIRSAGRAYVRAGGRIDLGRPARRYLLGPEGPGPTALYREAAEVDRPANAARRLPLLPFQRPIGLPPRFARAVVNLARVRAGDRVLDPFLGTGALLAEAGLLGARLYGIDRDRAMVRGALRNFAHLGLEAAELLEGDAAEVDFSDPAMRFSALLTDPPYGRSSGTGGIAVDELLRRVLPRWAGTVAPGGRVVVVVPSGAADLPAPWTPRVRVAVRVHRSLTREFRAYERRDPDGPRVAPAADPPRAPPV
jgi:tRNA (guanine10-N2)-dimethyltransferase